MGTKKIDQNFAGTPIKSGFTLVELLIVLVIIMIIAVLALFYFREFQPKARDAKRKTDISQLFSALELYKIDNGRYPQSTESNLRPGFGDSDLNPNSYVQDMSDRFTGLLPTDPLNNAQYHYSYQYFPQYTYQCDKGSFIIVGVRKFEASPQIMGGWQCKDHDFTQDFDWVLGSYE